ncbi:MAG: phosphoribosylformylglycinamidine cyclo-ligase [Pseudomonadota bacterium]
MSTLYKKSGVDIDAGNKFVDLIKDSTEKTKRKEVIGGLGGFGALYRLDLKKYKEPILVSSTDGVGTKVKLASELGVRDTIGQDLVAMCVNDIICSGAEPIFFLDYFAKGKLDPETDAEIIKGIAKACEMINCSLVGGETAEMPGVYHDNDYDLAGFAVGVVEESKIIDGKKIKPGDTCIGLASSGLHSNGYSLVRHLLKSNNIDPNTIVQELMAPTILYPPAISEISKSIDLHGVCHITGGGLWGNIPRIIPDGLKALIKRNSWDRPNIINYMQKLGHIEDDELMRVFNCGIGMMLVISKDKEKKCSEILDSLNYKHFIIGEIQKSEVDVKIEIV